MEIVFNDRYILKFYPGRPRTSSCEFKSICSNPCIEGSFCASDCNIGHMCLDCTIRFLVDRARDEDEKEKFINYIRTWLKIHPEVAL